MAITLDTNLILSQLNAPSLSDRIDALRRIRNDIIGHRQRKERWVQNGIIRILVDILNSVNDGYTIEKGARQQSSGLPRPFTQEETLKLHTIQLLNSLARAGPTFLPPLYAAGTLPAILSPSCLRSDQPQIVRAALHTLQSISNVATSSLQPALVQAVLANGKLELFLQILSQRVPTPETEVQVSLVADLITSLCSMEHHQNAMIDSGILDALATNLAAFAVAGGYVLPRAEILAKSSGLLSYIPEPALSDHGLKSVLSAIATIIRGSAYRVCKLVFSPSILAVFPNTSDDLSTYSKAPSETVELPGLRPTRQTGDELMDLLLPQMPAHSREWAQSAFSPLGAALSKESFPTKGRSASKPNPNLAVWSSQVDGAADAETEEAESPLIPWLIHLVRSRSGMEVVMAGNILSSLFKAGFTYKSREAALGLLVVPILHQILKENAHNFKADIVAAPSPTGLGRLNLLYETCCLLVHLIDESELLQNAAFDADAIKTLCKLLKSTYETPLPKGVPRPWCPDPNSHEITEDVPPECRLGDEEEVPVHKLILKVRGGALLGLHALASRKEQYRKEIVDQDAVPYIVESLQPSPRKPKEPKDKPLESLLNENINVFAPSEYGNNTRFVIAAACHTIRTLSRSVTYLRTTLVDHMVSIPVFRLLRHADLEIQVAATAAMCNLVPNFSPMREFLVQHHVLELLCELAHSQDPRLRLNALWALKHLVDSSSIELKKKCVEELESGWLVRLICDDMEDEALFSTRPRVGDEMDEDMDMGVPVDQDNTWQSAFNRRPSTTARQQPQQQLETATIVRLAELKITALRDAETDPVKKARHDDLAIQEQALGFIRNLIGGAHPSSSGDSTNDTTEMIDYLFNTLGQDRLFDILSSKLRPKVLHPFSRRGAGGASSVAGSETRIVPPSPKVIEAVIYILVHMAASVPRHRQVVVAQKGLMMEFVRLLDTITPAAAAGAPPEPVIGSSDSNSDNRSHKDKSVNGSANGHGSGNGAIRRKSNATAAAAVTGSGQAQAQAQASGNHKEIRLGLCYMVNNLSWQDDARDAEACAQRSNELRQIGFQSRLEHIAHADDELDVRERAKSALWQMKQGV